MQIRHFFLIFLASLAGAHDCAADLLADVREFSASARFKAAAQAAAVWLADDKLDQANQAYIESVPDDQLTPAQCFVLGNTFFSMEDALALKYHKRALDALPDEPYLNLEYAMDLHRAGKPLEAVSYYEKFIAVKPGQPLPHTLLADCLVRADRLKEAVEQWKLADHPRNHTSIDFAIHTIYGSALPHKRRDELLKAIRAGQTGKLAELVALSSNWDKDWWNADVKSELLERDLRLARVKLANSPGDLAEIETYAESYTQHVTANWLKDKLSRHGWILGPTAVLPNAAHVADRLVSLVLEHKLATETDLLRQFEKELHRRALSQGADDVMALNMLAHLLSGAGEGRFSDLAEVDQAGWDRYHDSRFAASLLTCQHGVKKLKSNSPQFLKARKEFPEDAHIAYLGVQMAEAEQESMLQPLVAAIKAEFRHLSKSRGIIKDSYRLKGLFALLEIQLRKQV